MICCPIYWSRAIILVDMNAFFASIEQRDHPELQSKPIAVTNGEQGSCVITCSYEARAFGVKTGMRLKQARQLCPELIQRPARPKRYAGTSKRIMQGLHDICPDIEIFSVDEAFLDVTHCQRLHGTPVRIGNMVKNKVYEISGLLCSVGISGDKTTAKYAAKLVKPDGLTVIPPWEAKQRLASVPVTELCGIAKGIGNFLAKYGVYTCGDMQHLPISILAKRFGNLGRRIWFMCQGADPDPIKQQVAAPKSMGHGKVMPPNTRDHKTILVYLLHMSEKLASRLRKHAMQAQTFFIGLRSYQVGWLGEKTRLAYPSNDGQVIYKMCCEVVARCWYQQAVCQVQVTALDPKQANLQIDMFEQVNEHKQYINAVMDQINAQYGEFTLSPARLLKRSSMPNVIAPAWKPDGHRQTI